MLTWDQAQDAFSNQALFREAGIPFHLSPQPLKLTPSIVRELERIGPSLRAFQEASQQLYQLSAKKKQFPWLAKFLDAGKPDWLVHAQHAAGVNCELSRVIRPDLLWCDSGLSLTEIDSVPGGLGLLHFLHQLYAGAGYTARLVGGADGVRDGLREAYPHGTHFAVSDESADYRPEMRYLVSALGEEYHYLDAENLRQDSDTACLYRFFELFDTKNIPAARTLIERWAAKELCMDAPPLAHLEEKAWLALFHLPGLQNWWKTHLRASHRQRLESLIPRSWLMDPSPLPPHASLPWLQINDWRDLASLSQSERRLVLKISGFDERAWGARGVYIGHDLSAEEWKRCVEEAHANFPHSLWIMQEYSDTSLISHPFYDPVTGELREMRGRVRLCPYYIHTHKIKRTRLMGCLATLVPEDKKKIHGMTNSIIIPCIV